MSSATKSLSLRVGPLTYLQHARQALVNELPPKHDLRKRIQPDGHGELLLEQPPGRPRASTQILPARKRGRTSSDPAMVLERRLLKTMWNEKYHLEEWERVRKKMSEHRKKLGMRERPYTAGDGCVMSKQDSSSKPYNGDGNGERQLWRSPGKRRRSNGDKLAGGDQGSIVDPRTKKKRRSGSGQEDRRGAPAPLASERDCKTLRRPDQAVESSGSAGRESASRKIQGCAILWTLGNWHVAQSPSTMSSGTADVPDRPIVADDAVPNLQFPAIAEVLGDILASGISTRSITERFGDPVSCNMGLIYIRLRDHADIDTANASIQKEETYPE